MPETPHTEHDAQAGVFPVRLLLPQERATVENMTKKAVERAPDAAMFDSHSPVFWTVEASNTKLDSYSTHMDVSTLKNYAADAEAGVSFQDGHLTDGLVRTLGQSIGSRYIGLNAAGREAGVAAVEVDFYTLLGLDPAIDSFVNKAQAGLVRDVSVGFYGGWYHCDLCDRDMQDYTDWNNYCPHVPGMRYPVYGPDGKPTKERVLATAGVMDARLAEVSGVYSGSTPDASILVIKARQLADAGKLDRDIAQAIQRQYRIALPGTARAFPVAGLAPSKEEPMPTKEQTATEERATPPTEERAIEARIAAATTAREGDIRAALATVGLSCEGDDLLAAIRDQSAALTELRARADEGKTYRADLIAAALTEGARANGKDFAEETYRGILNAAPLDAIKRMRDDWQGLASKTFPGGRQTTEEGGDGPHGGRSTEADTAPANTINPREAARFRTPGR